jgi:hypothetical protein
MLFLAFSFLASSTEVILEGDVGYISLNSTSTISTPFFGRTILAVSQKTAGVTFTYSTVSNGPRNPFPEEYSANIGSNTNIHVTIPDGGSARIAYATFRPGQCDNVTTATSKDYVYYGKLSQNTRILTDCLLFAPAAPNLQFNVKQAKMANTVDCITFYHERVNDAWYDRYETIEEESGWSAVSDRPWFMRFSAFRSGSENEQSSATVDFRGGDLISDALEVTLTPTQLPDGLPGNMKEIVDVWVPILGCIGPVVLLVSFIFAVCRLWRKAPLKPEPEE